MTSKTITVSKENVNLKLVISMKDDEMVVAEGARKKKAKA